MHQVRPRLNNASVMVAATILTLSFGMAWLRRRKLNEHRRWRGSFRSDGAKRQRSPTGERTFGV